MNKFLMLTIAVLAGITGAGADAALICKLDEQIVAKVSDDGVVSWEHGASIGSNLDGPCERRFRIDDEGNVWHGADPCKSAQFKVVPRVDVRQGSKPEKTLALSCTIAFIGADGSTQSQLIQGPLDGDVINPVDRITCE